MMPKDEQHGDYLAGAFLDVYSDKTIQRLLGQVG